MGRFCLFVDTVFCNLLDFQIFQSFSADQLPFDVDLPVKFVVYSVVGFMVGEGCPSVFSLLNI